MMNETMLFDFTTPGGWFGVVMEDLTLHAAPRGADDKPFELAEYATPEDLEAAICAAFPGSAPFVLDECKTSAPRPVPCGCENAGNLVKSLIESLSGASGYVLDDAPARIAALVEEAGLYVLEGCIDLDCVEFYPATTLEQYAKELFYECYDLKDIAKELGNLAEYVTIDFASLARDMKRFDGYAETRGGVLYAPEYV